MSDPAIQVDGLAKRYRIGLPGNTQNGRRRVWGALGAPFRYLASTLREARSDEVIWALREVSFEVQRGEVVGIIGRNGAGKSTLLKILSRITEPTAGRAVVHGRVGSLLEVGTGFHPELTGRENIYLNGAILGMKKADIDRRFDEIVAFAEVALFIDTPVKRYSSGMYVRLAFAVAAHLEPEIMLVDEVLAVGDLAFQQKCLKRISGLTRDGMTILLVSHNMAAIQSACSRALFLEHGCLSAWGKTQEVIELYRRSMQPESGSPESGRGEDQLAAETSVVITAFEMCGQDGLNRRAFQFGESIRVRIELMAHKRIDHPMINFGIRRGDGVVICNFNNWYDNFRIDYIQGQCTLTGWLPPLRLVPDYYEIHVLVWPWGGGHLTGDMTRSQPLAWTTFGDFRIEGPGLNAHDGVFQVPAQRWAFCRGAYAVEHAGITPDSLYEAFADEPGC